MRVRKGATDQTYDIFAPHIISDAGIKNTFRKLLPRPLAQRSYYDKLADQMKSSYGSLSLFIGLTASAKELDLTSQNTWTFLSNDYDVKGYQSLPKEKIMETKSPWIFIASPSAKNPLWEKIPGKKMSICQSHFFLKLKFEKV